MNTAVVKIKQTCDFVLQFENSAEILKSKLSFQKGKII